MPKSKTSLDEMLYDIRRIAEHREKLSEKKINALYRQLMKELKSFIADTYEKYSNEEGRLYIADLDKQRKRAWFLNEIVANCNDLSTTLKKEMIALINDTYKKSYEGMINAIKKADTAEELQAILKDVHVQPDILRQAVNNNVSKLTLNPVLEKHRAEIIYQLQRELVTGLLNGDRYDEMAKRITERVNVSQSKAMNIVRTESHKNVESGFMDCAEHIQTGLDGSDYIYAVTWRTMKDEKVRPQQRRKTKSGWKTYRSSNGANHQKLEGQTVKAGELFDLGGGVKAKAPSQSGVAAHDCNCRCFLEYNLMTVGEFAKATGETEEKVWEKYKIEFAKKKLEHNDLSKYNRVSDDEFAEWKKSCGKATREELKQVNKHEKENGENGGYVRSHKAWDFNAILRKQGENALDADDKKTLATIRKLCKNNVSNKAVILDRFVNSDYLYQYKGYFNRHREDLIDDALMFVNKKMAGKDIIEKSIVSASYGKNVLTDRDIHIVLHCPKGTHMFVTNNKRESEVLFQDGLTYEVVSAGKESYQGLFGHKHRLVLNVVVKNNGL